MNRPGRREVLVSLGTAGVLGALGGGATAAFLRDREALPPTVVESGDVRLANCSTGDRPSFSPVTLDLTRQTAFADRARIAQFGVETRPAWLVVRICPPTGDLGRYLDGTVRVDVDPRTGRGDEYTAAFGEPLVAPVDPSDTGGTCGDIVTIEASGDLNVGAVQDDGSDVSGEQVDLTAEILLVQRTGTSESTARAEFDGLFGDCPDTDRVGNGAPRRPPGPPEEVPPRREPQNESEPPNNQPEGGGAPVDGDGNGEGEDETDNGDGDDTQPDGTETAPGGE